MQALIQTAVNTVFNIVLLAGIPFLVYFVFQVWRRKRGFMEITERAGLRIGKPRYIGYCAIFSALIVAAFMLFPPPTELFTRDGSPQQKFVGLGLTGESITMAVLYGVIATGFCEELLFRGLIAGSLSRRLPLVWANVVQAFIFTLPHLLVLLITPEAWPLLPVIFIGSLFLGWARIRSGSIVGPWLIHATANVATCLAAALGTVDGAP